VTAVLVGASPFGSRALARLGIPFVLIVQPGESVSQLPVKPVHSMEVAYRDDPAALLRVVPHMTETPVGIFSFTEHGLLPAALLAEALSVPTVSAGAVSRTRHKPTMRMMLRDAVPQPRYGMVTLPVPAGLPFPVILKPEDGVGSDQIHLARGREDVVRVMERQDHRRFMYEEYLDGPEFSVETVTFDGEHTALGVTEKWVEQPRFIELQSVAVAGSATRHADVVATVCTALSALGVRCGAAHTEVKVARGRTYVIETHTRPAGDRIPLITELTSGYDQYELAIRSLLGMDRGAPSTPRYQAAGSRYFTWRAGPVDEVTGIDAARCLPGLEELHVGIRAGDQILHRTNSASRPAFAVAGGQDRTEVIQRLDEVEHRIRLRYRREYSQLSGHLDGSP